MELKKMYGKNVLITGGLGFIGSNIAHALVTLGAQVTLYDACIDPYGWNLANISEIKERVQFVKADTRDGNAMAEHIVGKDILIDCASQISHTISVEKPFLDIDINCNGAMTILEAARKHNDKIKLVYAGTRGQLGRLIQVPADENHPTNPTDINGINKLAAEKYYLLYNRIYGIASSSIRINNTYGIRSQMKHGDYSVVNWFMRRMLRDEPITIHGDGSQTRDYNYVEDVAEAFVLAAQSEKINGEVFLLGSGAQTRFIDVLNIIKELTGYRQEFGHIPRPLDREAIEIGNFQVSYDKIQSMLGWSPKTGLRDGLKKTVDFYRERLPEYL